MLQTDEKQVLIKSQSAHSTSNFLLHIQNFIQMLVLVRIESLFYRRWSCSRVDHVGQSPTRDFCAARNGTKSVCPSQCHEHMKDTSWQSFFAHLSSQEKMASDAILHLLVCLHVQVRVRAREHSHSCMCLCVSLCSHVTGCHAQNSRRQTKLAL